MSQALEPPRHRRLPLNLGVALGIGVAFLGVERWLSHGERPHPISMSGSATPIAGAGADHATQRAPAFALPPLSGDPKAPLMQLGDWHGKPVVINFYASWCDACRAERSVLMRLRDTVGAASMFGIGTMDQGDALRALEKDEPQGYPVALDEKGEVAAAFGIDALPQTYLVGGDGKILHHVYGALTEPDVEEFHKQLVLAERSPR